MPGDRAGWRHPTASQLAFELAHPEQVKLTARSERLQRDPLSTVWRRRFNRDLTLPKPKSDVAAQLAAGPIVVAAIDTEEGSGALNECLRRTAAQLLSTLPSARLACLNVLRLGRVTIDRTLDEQGNNKHIDRWSRCGTGRSRWSSMKAGSPCMCWKRSIPPLRSWNSPGSITSTTS